MSPELLASPDGPAALTKLGFSFPILLRRPGFHTGQHFVRVDSAAELALEAAKMPGQDLLVIEYLDARGQDGKPHKYRVMSIDKRLYPLHLAISENWKVHYFSSAMSGNRQYQAEEAAFLQDMPRALGAKAMRALEQVSDRLGLDYGGFDFALGRRGEVLLFEANATMLISTPQPEAQWDYRRAPIGRALEAVRRMVAERVEVAANGGLGFTGGSLAAA
jgi:hypothetical protein